MTEDNKKDKLIKRWQSSSDDVKLEFLTIAVESLKAYPYSIKQTSVRD